MTEALAWVVVGVVAAAYWLLVVGLAARAWAAVEEERRLLRYRPRRTVYVGMALMCLATPPLLAWIQARESAQRARKWIANR